MSSGTDTHEPVDRVSEFFDEHAGHYARNQYASTRRTFINVRQEKVLDLVDGLRLPAGARVLDAGCGPGALSVALARRGCSVRAMDLSREMLQIARSGFRAAKAGPDAFCRATIEHVPFADASFDLVCSSGVIEYLPDHGRAVAEFHRVLKPGGVLILPTTNLRAPANWPRPIADFVLRLPGVGALVGLPPRRFKVYLHVRSRFLDGLRAAGFAIERVRPFFLIWPRPLDRLLPSATERIERAADRHMDGPLGRLAEGFIAVGRKASGGGR